MARQISVNSPDSIDDWNTASLWGRYSTRSPKETFTRITEILTSHDSYPDRKPQPYFAGVAQDRHPYLVEAWTNIWEPSEDVKEWLDGY